MKFLLFRSWKCSHCKAVSVDKKVTVGYDKVMVNLPNRKVVTLKQTSFKCEQSKKDHYKVRKEGIGTYINFKKTRLDYLSGVGD